MQSIFQVYSVQLLWLLLAMCAIVLCFCIMRLVGSFADSPRSGGQPACQCCGVTGHVAAACSWYEGRPVWSGLENGSAYEVPAQCKRLSDCILRSSRGACQCYDEPLERAVVL